MSQETYATQAILIKRSHYRENDLRVVLYSKNRGLINLVARGAKKSGSKIAGHIEPFNLSQIMVVAGKKYDYLGSAININSFSNIKSDIDKTFISGRTFRKFTKLIKQEQGDEVIFFLFKDFLSILNSYEFSPLGLEFFHSIFIYKLLINLGYQIRTDRCSKCNINFNLRISQKIFFDISGGLYCSHCRIKGLIFSFDIIKLLEEVNKDDLLNILILSKNYSDNLKLEFVKLVENYYQYMEEI